MLTAIVPVVIRCRARGGYPFQDEWPDECPLADEWLAGCRFPATVDFHRQWKDDSRHQSMADFHHRLTVETYLKGG